MNLLSLKLILIIHKVSALISECEHKKVPHTKSGHCSTYLSTVYIEWQSLKRFQRWSFLLFWGNTRDWTQDLLHAKQHFVSEQQHLVASPNSFICIFHFYLASILQGTQKIFRHTDDVHS